jgi:prepilin-type processing-associated H-X9-DG protein
MAIFSLAIGNLRTCNALFVDGHAENINGRFDNGKDGTNICGQTGTLGSLYWPAPAPEYRLALFRGAVPKAGWGGTGW